MKQLRMKVQIVLEDLDTPKQAPSSVVGYAEVMISRSSTGLEAIVGETLLSLGPDVMESTISEFMNKKAEWVPVSDVGKRRCESAVIPKPSGE